jgi:hypothetical protein
MKKTLCFAALLGLINHASAQNSNPWPTTGNVGIGTASPNGKLEVVNNFASGTGGTALIVSAKGSGSSNGTTIYGAQVNASTFVGSSSTQTVYGIDVNATALGTGPSPLTAVNANTVLARLSGSTATGYYGGKFQVTGATGTSAASNISNYGLYGEVANTNATGEVSNSYGVLVRQQRLPQRRPMVAILPQPAAPRIMVFIQQRELITLMTT